jgi:hypothetical protein
MKARGVSTVAMSRSSIASMVAENIIDSITTVRGGCLLVCCCLLPSAQPRALILPHRFFDMNIRKRISARFWTLDSLLLSTGLRGLATPRATIPDFPDPLSPYLRLLCVIMNASRSGGSSLVQYESHVKDTLGFCLDLSRSRWSPSPFGLCSSFHISICGGAAESGEIPFSFLIFFFIS